MKHLSSPPASSLLVIFAALLASAPLDAAPAPPLARTADGQSFAAKLLKVDADWTITFDVAGQQRRMPAAELVAWSNPAEARRSQHVFTVDGSLLVGQVALISEDKLVVLTDLVGTVSLPLEQVRGVVFRLPADRAERDRLAARIDRAKGDTDRLILANGDQLTGTVLGLENLHIRLKTEAGTVKIDVAKAAALIFNPTLLAPHEARGLRALVGLGDGTLLMATSLTISEAAMRAKLSGGVELSSDTPEDVISLQPFGGRVIYLSDLAAHRFRHVPYLDLSWPYHRDHNVLDGRLRAGGRLYSKGLGMHSAARLTYRLDGSYRRFQAELAIDEVADRRGSVVFRVFTSGGQTWREAFTSSTIRGRMAPLSISVDLTGAKAIALVVDFADRGDQQDYADWLDARLIQ